MINQHCFNLIPPYSTCTIFCYHYSLLKHAKYFCHVSVVLRQTHLPLLQFASTFIQAMYFKNKRTLSTLFGLPIFYICLKNLIQKTQTKGYPEKCKLSRQSKGLCRNTPKFRRCSKLSLDATDQFLSRLQIKYHSSRP